MMFQKNFQMILVSVRLIHRITSISTDSRSGIVKPWREKRIHDTLVSRRDVDKIVNEQFFF
jgi:hypothetical protein